MAHIDDLRKQFENHAGSLAESKNRQMSLTGDRAPSARNTSNLVNAGVWATQLSSRVQQVATPFCA